MIVPLATVLGAIGTYIVLVRNFAPRPCPARTPQTSSGAPACASNVPLAAAVGGSLQRMPAALP